MKTLIKISLFSACIWWFASCSDFLDEDPRGQQMQETFYQTDAEAFGGLMGIYALATNSQATAGMRENFIVRSEPCSDLLTYKPVASAEAVAFPKYTLHSEITPLVIAWEHAYSVIYTTNSYIHALTENTSPDIPADKKEQYIKEAKFFRSLMYYHLVMRWGDVPLRMKPTHMKETDIARSPAEEVWKHVIMDLEAAATLPDKNNTPAGRITKGAVLTLLAKVHLMKGDFPSAATVLDQITGYSLMPEIGDVWNTEKKFNEESIWEVNIERGTLPRQGLGMLSFYLPMHDAFKGANATFPVNDYLMQMTEEDSPRTKLFYSRKPLLEEISADYKGEYRYTDSQGEEQVIIFTNATEPLYPHIMKFTDFTTVGHEFEVGDCPFNQLIFRYADVVLMKAEVECELNGATPVALNYLNQIRSRAGETLYTLTGEDGLRPLNSKEDLQEAIRNERALELVGEGHRFYDLKRWGTEYALRKLKESRQAHIAGTTFCYNPEDLVNIEAYRLLWPIPKDELNGNALMVQNPGY